MGVGDELCSDEHAKRENTKVNKNTLVFNFIRVLISLLLADGIPQDSQSFYLHDNFISIL